MNEVVASSVEANELGLHAACRAGFLERVRYLLEEEKAKVNELDSFDSTPLFYAVYGGHEGVVQLLLANGAKCEPETFTGERCYYGALNDSIRSLLKAHNATDFSVAATHPFSRFIRGLAKAERFHDIRFRLGDDSFFSGCRAVLGARSSALRSRLAGAWLNKETVALSTHKAPAEAFRAVLAYVLGGRLAVDASLAQSALGLARALRLDSRLLETLANARAVDRAVVVYEDDVSTLRESMEPLATYAAAPLDAQPPKVDPELASFASAHCDATLECDDGLLRVPSVFLRAQSDVIDAALSRDFKEASRRRFKLPGFKTSAASAVVRFCICGTCAADLKLDATLAAEVIALTHRLLLPNDLLSVASGTLADALLASHPDAGAALDCLAYANLAGDQGFRLYHVVCRVIASDLTNAASLPAFHDAVLQSALSIQQRESTDSIPLIDDIRTAVRILFNPLDLDQQPQEQDHLDIIDNLLEKLHLDG